MQTIEEAEGKRNDFLLANLKETGYLSSQEIMPHWGHNGQIFTAWNQQYIAMQAKERGYSDPRYWTFKQANDAGFRIKKGAKAIHSGRLVEYDNNLHGVYDHKKALAAAKTKGISIDDYKKQFKENKFQTVSLYNAAEVVGVKPMQEISAKDKKNMLNAFLKYNCGKYQVGIEEQFDKDNEYGFYRNQLSKLAAAVAVTQPGFKPELSEMSRMIWVSERLREAGFPKEAEMNGKISAWAQSVSPEEAKEVFQSVNYMTSASRFNGLSYQNIKDVSLLSKANARDRQTADAEIVEKSDKYPEIAVPKMVYDEISEAVTERLYVQQGLSRYMTKDEFDRILSQSVNQLKEGIMKIQEEKIAEATREEGEIRLSSDLKGKEAKESEAEKQTAPQQTQAGAKEANSEQVQKPEEKQSEAVKQQQPQQEKNLAQKIIAQRRQQQSVSKQNELAV